MPWALAALGHLPEFWPFLWCDMGDGHLYRHLFCFPSRDWTRPGSQPPALVQCGNAAARNTVPGISARGAFRLTPSALLAYDTPYILDCGMQRTSTGLVLHTILPLLPRSRHAALITDTV